MKNRQVYIELPGERPQLTIQDFYSGVNHHLRTAEKNRIHALVRAHLDPNESPFTGPVLINVTLFFGRGSRAIDCSNVPIKLYEDALKGWLLVDDSHPYVMGVSAHVVPAVVENHVTIAITQVGDDFPFTCGECGACLPTKAALRAHRKREGCGGGLLEVD